jgi:transposase-like protein
MGKTKHTPEFKKKIAIEALREQKTIQEIARTYQVHPAQVSVWKKQLLDNASTIFGGKKHPEKNYEGEMAILERKVGQLTIENDFLKKKLER